MPLRAAPFVLLHVGGYAACVTLRRAHFVRAAALVLALAVLATLLAGCGDDSDEPRTLSKREYISRANELQGTATTVFAQLKGRAPASTAAAKAHLDALDQLIDGYAKLRPPATWRDEHRTMLQSLRTMREAISTIARANAKGASIIQVQLTRYRDAQRDFERAVRSINASR